MMIFCTKVMRPGWGRIGRLGENFTLPRTVSASSALGGLIGAVIGAMLGAFVFSYAFNTLTSVLGTAMVGAMTGVALVGWEPWKGEHLGWVALTRSRALRTVTKMQCPGGSRLPVLNTATGQHYCPECAMIIDPEDDLIPAHEWKRRLYLGVMPIPTPQTGEIIIVPSNVIVPKEFYRPSGTALTRHS